MPRRVREESAPYDVDDLPPEDPPDEAPSISFTQEWAQGGGFTQLQNRFLRDGRINVHEKVVAAIIASYASEYRSAWPGYETLMAQSGIGRTTLAACIRHLIELGILTSERRKMGETNRYTISYGCILPTTPDVRQTAGSSSPHELPSFARRTTSVRQTNAMNTQVKNTYQADFPSAPPYGAVAPKPAAVDVSFASLSKPAQDALNDWREKQGKRRPPKLNPALAARIEAAIVDLGPARLSDSATWAAEHQVPEVIKWIRAAETKRQREEQEGAQPHGASRNRLSSDAIRFAGAPSARESEAVALARTKNYSGPPTRPERLARRTAAYNLEHPDAPIR